MDLALVSSIVVDKLPFWDGYHLEGASGSPDRVGRLSSGEEIKALAATILLTSA